MSRCPSRLSPSPPYTRGTRTTQHEANLEEWRLKNTAGANTLHLPVSRAYCHQLHSRFFDSRLLISLVHSFHIHRSSTTAAANPTTAQASRPGVDSFLLTRRNCEPRWTVRSLPYSSSFHFTLSSEELYWQSWRILATRVGTTVPLPHS